MHRFPIVSMALWLFVLGTGALFFWGSGQMAADFTSQAMRRDTAVPVSRPAPAPALPKLTAIDFDPSRAAIVGVAAAEPDEPAAPLPVPTTQKLVVSATSLNIRMQPNSKSGKVAALRQGEQVDLLTTEGKWSQVRTATGATGWAFTQYLSAAR